MSWFSSLVRSAFPKQKPNQDLANEAAMARAAADKSRYNAEQAIAEAQAAAAALQRNFGLDLSADNIATIVPGGLADTARSAANLLRAPRTLRKTSRASLDLASRLGVKP